jgi:hypothetical protein
MTIAHIWSIREGGCTGRGSTLPIWLSTQMISPLWLTAFQACDPPYCQVLTIAAVEPCPPFEPVGLASAG